ncbi:hypothetical protein ACFU6S_41645 [Streptomyces sp. NPDC057456]|uniref:hypothetical protein n=1 Tax=Streptomyces sp. NPDC057456 TaxID=3346139 RepID=UPI0036A4F76D
MAGRVRHCAYINCSKPLPAGARSDKLFCDRKCKIAHLRWRRHRVEAVAIGLWYTLGRETEHIVRCPACGRRFALGHGHRKDSVYCRPACRQAAYRARKAQERVREGVTTPSAVAVPGTRSLPLASDNAMVEKATALTPDRGVSPPAAGARVALGDVPGDRVDAGPGVPLQGAARGVVGAGQQHRGGGAALGIVRQGTVAEPVQREAVQVLDVLG